MIEFLDVDIFDSNAQALVNPVNCVGVMGSGLAKEFKRRFPECFDSYLERCKTNDPIKKLCPGMVQVVEIEKKRVPTKYVINFPTKDHYRAKSKSAFIEAGLEDLVRVVSALKICSLAIPKLGCGLGGLDWQVVKPLMEHKLNPLVDTHIIICLG
jgi:O-acetyl-ADP-ribose deacetylase (regulator of RNase III)